VNQRSDAVRPDDDFEARLARFAATVRADTEGRSEAIADKNTPEGLTSTNPGGSSEGASSSEYSKPARAQALPELESAAFYNEQIVAEYFTPPREAQTVSGPYGLHPRLEEYLAASGRALYSHQASVIESVQEGEHVVLSTQTASGKSLAFHLPTFDRLLSDQAATALYLYPTKALAHDQLDTLIQFDQAIGGVAQPAVYDGDTATKERAAIRERSRLVITNPHGLNLYLGWPSGWDRFLSNLAVVVVDESHTYTGVLGSHVAMVVRRLRRLASARGANPQFIFASGTIANPKEHAEALGGLPVQEIANDGSPQSGRWMVVWDAVRDVEHSPTTQSALLTRHLLRCRRRVIVFSDSRNQAEAVARQASDRSNVVLAYRAGYAATTRRRIEADVKEDRIKGISSTSALEVGIDIGTLDTVVCNGYPGSMASLLQRAGRAGRSGNEAVTVLVCGGDPVSRYLVRAPESIIQRPPERAVINLTNDAVLRAHLRCAAAELPFSSPNEAVTHFGEMAGPVLEDLRGEGLLVEENGTIRSATKLPHRGVSFIQSHGPTYLVDFINASGGSAGHERLSMEHALRDAHKGAIFPHQGLSYRVRQVDHDTHHIRAVYDDTHSFTSPQLFRAIVSAEVTSSTTLRRGVSLSLSELRLTEQVVGYREFRGGLETKHKVTSPALNFTTQGVAIHFASEALVGAERHCDDPIEALHGLEHALQKALPLVAICSHGDVSGMTTRGDDEPHIVLYDRTPGGVGLAEVVFDHFDRLCRETVTMIERCPCRDGCPFCTLDPSCRDVEITKAGALDVAYSLIGASPGSQTSLQ
jgi:DEAD/DEAH box helicase domain-containing protein